MPPRWKLAVLNWLGVFPLITLILELAETWLAPLPLLGQTFVLTLLLVPTMIFVVMPVLTRIFAGWLGGL